MKRNRARLFVILAVFAIQACGCALYWKGQPLLAVDPIADVWVHHPEAGTNTVTHW